MSELDSLAGRKAVYEQITIHGIALAILGGHPECSGWLIQFHSARGDYRVASYAAEPDSIGGQLRALADTINCSIVVHDEARVMVVIDKPHYSDARGVFGWQEGDEPAEDTIRRIRGDDQEGEPA